MSNTLFATIYVAGFLLHLVNTQSHELICGDTVSDVFELIVDEDPPLDQFQFAINDSYNVDFYLCYNYIDVDVDFSIQNNREKPTYISYNISDYCADEEMNIGKGFTVTNMPPSTPGEYLIKMRPEPQSERLGNSPYSLSANCVSTSITCGDVVSNTINHVNVSHYYQLTTNSSYNVNFDSCHSDADIYFLITDSQDNDITDEYCPNITNECGVCSNGKDIHENFTIANLSSGVYTIEVYPHVIDNKMNKGGIYNLSVSCAVPTASPTNNPTSNPTTAPAIIKNIRCGDVLTNVTNNQHTSSFYQFIINNSYNVNFYFCHDTNTIWSIQDNLHNDVAIEYRPNTKISDYCSNGNNYAENFIVSNMSAGVYLITIFPNNTTNDLYDLSIHCVSTSDKETDSAIIAFAVSGIVQIVIAIIALWLVSGYFMRFRRDFIHEKIILYSVIGNLLLAFMEGCIRSFILTNVFVAGAQTVLGFRCDYVFWSRIYILQLGQLLMYNYLLSKLQSLRIFQTAMYYFLLFFISCLTLFTTVILAWYSVPIISYGEGTDPQLMICMNSTPSDVGLYEEYVVFLAVNAISDVVLLVIFLYRLCQSYIEYGCRTLDRINTVYKILILGIFVVLLNLSEFIYFCITEDTFYVIRFIVYSIVIVVSFNICSVKESDARWCCWCWIEENIGFI